jgi:hypothetical protein
VPIFVAGRIIDFAFTPGFLACACRGRDKAGGCWRVGLWPLLWAGLAGS